jgi:hypothetical protein
MRNVHTENGGGTVEQGPCPDACLQPDTPKDAIPWPISFLIFAVAVAAGVTAAVWGEFPTF